MATVNLFLFGSNQNTNFLLTILLAGRRERVVLDRERFFQYFLQEQLLILSVACISLLEQNGILMRGLKIFNAGSENFDSNAEAEIFDTGAENLNSNAGAENI